MSTADIGRRAGVSRTTVSFVLNNAPGKNIPETTRQRVLDAAHALGYPSAAAVRGYRRHPSRTIALFVCRTQFFFSDAFINRVVQGMTQVLNTRGAGLVLQPVGTDEHDYPRIARHLDADGVVLVNTHARDTGLVSLLRAGMPTVAIGGIGRPGMPCVRVADVAAARAVTEYLLGLGHRRIGMILHAPTLYHAARERCEGFRAALRAAGRPYPARMVVTADFSVDSGYDRMRRLLQAAPRPTAVFCTSDGVAAGALRALRDADVEVPATMSIAGFEDDLLSRYLHPPLTSLSLPAEGMGGTAAALLLDLLEGGPGVADRVVTLPTRLVVRASCAAPPQASPARLRSAPVRRP